MREMNWIKPPWRDCQDEDGCWPWVGDQFIAAIQVYNNLTGALYWEYWILSWDENGLKCNGESWDTFLESDIEWIAKIPAPE